MAAESRLAAVLADPGNDLPRLVHADWLEEHGQAEWAALIRYMVRTPGLPWDAG